MGSIDESAHAKSLELPDWERATAEWQPERRG
jgi:hypothetical protein